MQPTNEVTHDANGANTATAPTIQRAPAPEVQRLREAIHAALEHMAPSLADEDSDIEAGALALIKALDDVKCVTVGPDDDLLEYAEERIQEALAVVRRLAGKSGGDDDQPADDVDQRRAAMLTHYVRRTEELRAEWPQLDSALGTLQAAQTAMEHQRPLDREPEGWTGHVDNAECVRGIAVQLQELSRRFDRHASELVAVAAVGRELS